MMLSLASRNVLRSATSSCRIASHGLRFMSSEVPQDICVEKLGGDDEGISVFTFNRPKAKNAFNKNMANLFRAAIADVRFSNTRVVIIRSVSDDIFCAGADLKERATMPAEEVGPFVAGLRSSFDELAALPMPTIAAIEGPALGGGLELALSCDFRVGGEKALVGLPETGLAIIPGAGGTQRLARLVGESRAKELIFTGRRINAQTAADMGILTRAVRAGGAYDSCLELAREIIPNGPVAVRMAKASIDAGMQTDIRTGMAIEQACYAQVIPTEDRLEGLTAFREKRRPVYTGK